MPDTAAPTGAPSEPESPFQTFHRLHGDAKLTPAELRFIDHVRAARYDQDGIRTEILHACAVLLTKPRLEETPQPDRAMSEPSPDVEPRLS